MSSDFFFHILLLYHCHYESDKFATSRIKKELISKRGEREETAKMQLNLVEVLKRPGTSEIVLFKQNSFSVLTTGIEKIWSSWGYHLISYEY